MEYASTFGSLPWHFETEVWKENNLTYNSKPQHVPSKKLQKLYQPDKPNNTEIEKVKGILKEIEIHFSISNFDSTASFLI